MLKSLPIELAVLVTDFIDSPSDLYSLCIVFDFIPGILPIRRISSINEDNGQTVFHLAAAQGNHEMIQTFLAQGADPNLRENEGTTPLQLAAAKGRLKTAKTLLDAGADATLRDDYNITALWEACNEGHVEVARLILSRLEGKDKITTVNDLSSGVDSLGVAVRRNDNIELVSLLIANGAEVDRKDNFGDRPLHSAASRGHLATVEMLVKAGSNVNSRDNDDLSPLHHASIGGHLATVDYLLRNGAKINHATMLENYTPLFMASQDRNFEVVEGLIRAGADVKILDNWGRSSLHAAAESGCAKTCRVLIEGGLTINHQDGMSQTALYKATVHNNVDVVTFLLENGANPNISDHLAISPLHQASKRGFVETMILLIKNGAVIEAKDRYGNTPLYWAACLQNSPGDKTAGVELLLDNGANPSTQCNFQLTALHRAVQKSFTTVVDCLLKRGADPLVRGPSEATPLHLAARHARIDVVKTLLDTCSKKLDLLLSASDVVGRTPLYYATQYDGKNKDKARLLLDRGADMFVKFGSCTSPLVAAVEMGCHEILNLYIEKNALTQNQNRDEDEWGILLCGIALYQSDSRALKSLLQAGVDVNKHFKTGTEDDYDYIDEQVETGGTLLHLAASGFAGFSGMVELLLSFGAFPDIQNHNGRTALHEAAKAGNTDTLKVLLRSRAYVTRDKNGRTALHEAARAGNISALRELLRWGAVTAIGDENGCTALHEAARAGKTGTLKELLRWRAYVPRKDKNGRTALHEAARAGNIGTLKELLRWGADVAIQDKNGRTALDEAICSEKSNRDSLVDILLNAGAAPSCSGR